MKKILLSLTAILMTSGLALAQFTVTSTGVSFTGNTPPATGPNKFYLYQPDNRYDTPNPATDIDTINYKSVDCTTKHVALGGFAPDVYDATGATCACYNAGVVFYGGGIANTYYGPNCDAHLPSFGFTVGTPFDLSNVANQTITFTYQSTGALAVELQLFSTTDYVGKLNSLPFNILNDGQVHTQTINLASFVATGADMTNVNQFSFVYPSTTKSDNFGFAISQIRLGGIVTGLTNSTSVANANLYPNPSTGITTISGELKSIADVKITLVDMLGQEVKVISEERTNTINASFDVSTLKKGIYSVVTNIDGAPSKSQMLVVR